MPSKSQECFQRIKHRDPRYSRSRAQEWQGRKRQRRTRSADDSAFYHMAAQNHGV